MRTLFFPLALLAGCDFLGKPSDEGPHCADTPTDIGLDDTTALGFTANDVIAGLPSMEDTLLLYADGTTTELNVGFAPGTTARFVDSEAVYPEGGMTTDIGVICDDRVEIDGTFTFATSDGAFAESFASVLTATAADAVGLHEELDLDGLAGTFAIEPFVDATDYDALSAWIDVSFAGGASTGAIDGQASGEDECDGDECSAWAAAVPVASWPIPSE